VVFWISIPQLFDSACDRRLRAAAAHDRGGVLGDNDARRRTKLIVADVFELHAEVFGNDAAARQRGDVVEHGFASIPEAWRFDCNARQRTAQLVHHQRGERLAVDVLGDDDEWMPRLYDAFQQRQETRHRGDLLVADQNPG
jgi:hypothetical protein